MELKQLSYFVAVVEEGSFSAAARKLFMSQPPITTQVKALEEELGCTLLVRGTRAVRPTEEGRLLYDRARLMLEMRRSVTEEIEARSISGGGTLRLGVVSSVASSLLPGWLSGFHALNPKVRLELYEDNTYELLEKLRAHVEPLGYPLFALSAASHTGTRELVLKIAEKLSTLPPVTVYEPEYVPKPVKIDASEPLKITVEDNTYIVEGKWLERLMSNINFGDYESRMFFDKMLRENGVFQQLEDLGIKDGDIVSMYELEFEYQH